MKTIVKTLFATLALAFAIAPCACADRETPITTDQLPAAAQQAVKQHFGDRKVALATKEREGLAWAYEVTFANGDQVEFDKNGNWTGIDCKRTSVPQALIPAFVQQYVGTNYAGAQVLELSRDKRGYEAKLSNRLELEFDKNGRLTDIDD